MISALELDNLISFLDVAALTTKVTKAQMVVNSSTSTMDIYLSDPNGVCKQTLPLIKAEDDFRICVLVSSLRAMQKTSKLANADSMMIRVGSELSSLTYIPYLDGKAIDGNVTKLNLYGACHESEIEENEHIINYVFKEAATATFDEEVRGYLDAFNEVINMASTTEENLGLYLSGDTLSFTDNRHIFYKRKLSSVKVDSKEPFFIASSMFKALCALNKKAKSVNITASKLKWVIKADNATFCGSYNYVECPYPTDEEEKEMLPADSDDTATLTFNLADLDNLVANFEVHPELYTNETLKPVYVEVNDDACRFSWESSNESFAYSIPYASKEGKNQSFIMSMFFLKVYLKTADSMTVSIKTQDVSLDDGEHICIQVYEENCSSGIVKLKK